MERIGSFFRQATSSYFEAVAPKHTSGSNNTSTDKSSTFGSILASLRFSNASMNVIQGALRVKQYFPKALILLAGVTGIMGQPCESCESYGRTYSTFDFSNGTSILHVAEHQLSQAWITASAATCYMSPMNEPVSGIFKDLGCFCYRNIGESGGCNALILSGINIAEPLKTCVLNAFEACESGSMTDAEKMGIILGSTVLAGGLGMLCCGVFCEWKKNRDVMRAEYVEL